MTNYNIPEIDNLSSDMINTIISGLDISDFYQDGKIGFIDWAKVQHLLFDVHPKIVLYYSKKALRKYRWLWNYKYVFYEQCSSFVTSILIQWNDLLNQSKIDLQHPYFIQYLIGLIEKYHFAIKFIEKEASIADSFKRKKIRAIIAAGRRNGKTYDEIEKDIQQYRLRVTSLSEMDRSDATNEDINGNGFDVLEAKPDSQNQIFQDLKYLIKQFIKHLDKKYLDEEYKEDDESKSITQVYRQAGAQLYPDMIESNLSDSPEAWTYSAQKQPVCNQKGIQCIIQKTLNIIKQNNPEQSPELTLYDVHYKAALETDCKKDEESETAVDSYTKSPIVKRHFRPIKDLDDLKLLFGITSSGNAVKERFLYMQEVGKWIKKIIEQRKEESTCDK